MTATIKDVKDFFGMKPGQSLKEFAEEWKAMDDASKEQIRQGLGDGTLTY